jgi:hypothetical protein
MELVPTLTVHKPLATAVTITEEFAGASDADAHDPLTITWFADLGVAFVVLNASMAVCPTDWN